MRCISGLAAMAILLVLGSCSDKPAHPDTLSTGSINISADETYRNVIAQELRVFDSSYPNAHITCSYKPEAECFQDYFNGKARIILVTRQLSSAEKKMCADRQMIPSSLPLAKDAVAVIVNAAAADSMDVEEIKGILTGASAKKYTVVFDNERSSTVRYIIDSLLSGQHLGTNVFAAKTSEQVVNYVATNMNAIGFTGLSAVVDTSDSTGTGTFIKKVNVVAIRNDSLRQFYKPYQAYVALRRYPFTRCLYYVSREGYPGLGTGFANFLAGARGQLIFGHAELFPQQMTIVIRDAEINNQN